MMQLKSLRMGALLMALAFCNLSITTVQAFAPQSTSFMKNIHSKPQQVYQTNSQLQMSDGEINGSDRIKSCIPYFLPILDGDQFGRFIYQRIPPLGLADQIFVQPIASLYHSIPFLSLGLFILLSLGTRNPEISRSLRFNAQQALLIDIALIFPELLGSVTPNNLPLMVVEPSTNFVYYAYISAVLYSIFSNLTGKKPNQIPVISDAAEMALGPF